MRPDQAKFDDFVRPLEGVDKTLQKYANSEGFTLEKNQNRAPGRILRKGSNPILMIEIFLEPVWHKILYDDSLPYCFCVGAIYKGGALYNNQRWKLNTPLVDAHPLGWIKDNMSQLLLAATSILPRYTPEYIIQHGLEAQSLLHLNPRH